MTSKNMAKNKQSKNQLPNTSKTTPDMLANICLLILNCVAAVFVVLTPALFIYLNRIQSHYFIDEKFHIPQTQQYCRREFSKWNPKITTLPGLYLFTATIFGPFDLCSIKNLRSINVLLTFINLVLIFKILKVLNISKKKLESKVLFLRAWNLAFFPPLFFWFFLYYTDIFSVSLILMMLLSYINDRDNLAAFIGALTICVRQTNVVWVALLGIEKSLTTIEGITKKPELVDSLNIFKCLKTISNILRAEAKKGAINFIKYFVSICKSVLPYVLVLISFIVFLILNGGIVLGDRTAHKPTLHVVQIFYYSIFVLSFSWPYLIPYLKSYFKYLYQHFFISSICICLILAIVHFNTLVHPYILADNRHYSFYIWKNLMNKYYFFKYLLIPIYTFAIFAILKSLSHLRLLSLVAYLLCVSIVLVPQLLLEPRYFIIPYIIFRLRQKDHNKWQIIAETITTFIINAAQFLLFINKSFNWEDEDNPQRIAW